MQPPSKSGGASPWGGKRHHGVRKADRSTGSDRTRRGAAHQRGATGHARESSRRPQPRHTDRCQATTATGCGNPGQRAQRTANHGTGTGARQHLTHTPQTRARNGGVQEEDAHRHTHPHTPAMSGGAQPKPEPKHPHPHRTPQPGLAGKKGYAHPNAHTAQHPSQEWQGAAQTRAQAHTPTWHAQARISGVQEDRAHKHTQTQTPKVGVAGRSPNLSPSTHTHTAHPSHEWRGTN